jgi:aspartate/methionine/tyrosine aminotransferase
MNLSMMPYHLSPEERTTLYGNQNPNMINLAVAENVLLFEKYLKNVFGDCSNLSVSDVKYVTAATFEDLQRTAAEFLSDSYGLTGDRRLGGEDIIGVSGVSAALECLAFSICEPGDSVLLPTPCWQGFEWCLSYRPNVRLIKIPLYPAEGFELTLKAVIAAYSSTEPKPRALVLTNPHNPLSINYDPAVLRSIYEWVLNQTDMHIISDEIYFHSQVGVPRHKFVSAFAMEPYSKDRVHAAWGFAKDFGVSGFKAGFVMTRAQAVLNKIKSQRMASLSPFDSLKIFMLLGKLLKRDSGQFIRRLVPVYQKELTNQFTLAKQALDRNGIKYFGTPEAAQFFWLDLTKYLGRAPDAPVMSAKEMRFWAHPEVEDERERKLDAYIKRRAEVALLPGQTMFCPAPGWFRLCFTCEEIDKVTEAIQRLANALKALGA